MKTNQKPHYEIPVTQVMEISAEQCFAQSDQNAAAEHDPFIMDLEYKWF